MKYPTQAAHLKRLRYEAGLTQEALSHETGVDRVRICHLESGRVEMRASEISVYTAKFGPFSADYWAAHLADFMKVEKNSNLGRPVGARKGDL